MGGALEGLLRDLREGRGYRFLDPWAYSPKSLALAVPIVREGPVGERRYLLLDEIPGGIAVRDEGSIRKLLAENRIDKPVFVRSGCILEGKTQPRVVKYGVVIEPGSRASLEVFCVAEREPIRRGSSLKPGRDLPAYFLARRFRDLDQHLMWSAIRVFSEERLAHRAYSLGFDLTKALDALERARGELAKVVEKVPVFKGQVGVAVVDPKGVYALELFDHPDSWSAIARKAAERFAEVLAEQQEYQVFKPSREGVFQAIHDFLEKLSGCRERVAVRGRSSETVLLEGDGVYGEYTVLEGEVIHLLAAREEDLFRGWLREMPRILPMRFTPRRIEEDLGRMSFFSVEYLTPPRVPRPAGPRYISVERARHLLLDVLKLLKEGPKTWSEIERRLRGRASTATLSRRLKECLEEGLVVKTVRENGKAAYQLTARGQALVEDLEGRSYP